MEGYRGGYAPMLRAALELSARGVFDASEITPLREVSKAGKLDEMMHPFPADGTFKGCSFMQVTEGLYTIAYESEEAMYVEQFKMESNLTGGMLHLYISEREIICELFSGANKATTSAIRSTDRGKSGSNGSPERADTAKEDSWSVRKYTNRRSGADERVDTQPPSERSRRRYSLRYRNK